MAMNCEVQLRRSGRWWTVDIPELGIYTQVRVLAQAEIVAREAIATQLKIPADTVEMTMVVPEAAPVLQPVLEARQARAAAVISEHTALAQAANVLVTHLGMRPGDAAVLLGIERQQVDQLVQAQA
ncbi:type II toxin-antitoxin system HicB family antitoxin [Streptomyces sp. NPDC058424]|uniref:type II toxin-antitoxin system HicB family antitoxin n=1 Tax=Streptomyces sp. NPDC058424 TaxID=3346491 RepID=UPI003657A54D